LLGDNGDVLGLRVRRGADRGYREIEIAGELDRASADQLEVVLAAAEDNVILDLTECEFVDSTGIAVIATAWHLRQLFGRRLICFGARPKIEEVLEITGLVERGLVVQTREEALLVISPEHKE
jgi:anti-sigma B factor antagonist